MTDKEHLEKLLAKYLKHLTAGELEKARAIATSLYYETYVRQGN